MSEDADDDAEVDADPTPYEKRVELGARYVVDGLFDVSDFDVVPTDEQTNEEFRDDIREAVAQMDSGEDSDSGRTRSADRAHRPEDVDWDAVAQFDDYGVQSVPRLVLAVSAADDVAVDRRDAAVDLIESAAEKGEIDPVFTDCGVRRGFRGASPDE